MESPRPAAASTARTLAPQASLWGQLIEILLHGEARGALRLMLIPEVRAAAPDEAQVSED